MIPPKYVKSLVIAVAVVVMVAVAMIWGTCSRTESPFVEIETVMSKEIAVTPQVVERVRDISQWEFVKLTDDEVVDTLRKVALWPDDRLVLIFHGTPRIGIDLSDAPDDWVVNNNDSITVTLPQPRLLDPQFIDEALTEVFAQSGSWSASDRERMYESARSRMTARALEESNLDKARKAAAERFTAIFTSLGAEHVDVCFVGEVTK